MKRFRSIWRLLLGLALLVPAGLYGAPQSKGPTNPPFADGNSPSLLQESFKSFLDGDHQPDTVECKLEGAFCRLTIQLSQRNESISLGTRAIPGNVVLSAVDIDRDNDRDLVISTPGDLFPLAVWLNDGAGHFTGADPKRYAVPDAPITKDGSIHGNGDTDGHAVATIQSGHWSLDKPATAFQAPVRVAQAVPIESQSHNFQWFLSCLPSRAPPSKTVA
jgi:hypothetical protein